MTTRDVMIIYPPGYDVSHGVRPSEEGVTSIIGISFGNPGEKADTYGFDLQSAGQLAMSILQMISHAQHCRGSIDHENEEDTDGNTP